MCLRSESSYSLRWQTVAVNSTGRRNNGSIFRSRDDGTEKEPEQDEDAGEDVVPGSLCRAGSSGVPLTGIRLDDWAFEVDGAFIAECFDQASLFEHSL